MWDWEKAIPREMYIHMSTMDYRDEEDILYTLSLKQTCIAAMYSPPVQS